MASELHEVPSSTLNVLFFAQARSFVGTSRIQISLVSEDLAEAKIISKESFEPFEIEISISSLRNFLLNRFPA